MRKWNGLLLIVSSVALTAGCFGPSGYRQTNIAGHAQKDLVSVSMTVHMERTFVRANSGLGGGSVVMYLALGPFARNVIMMYGDIKDKDQTVSTFSKRMVWGENNLTFQAPRASMVQLKLRTGGTRSGTTDIGFVKIGTDPSQKVVVRLDEKGATIE